MKKYIPAELESRWQRKWQESGLYKIDLSKSDKKYYLLVEFTYPSGDLHMGHWFAFAVPDILARTKRMQGYNVFAPNGFDAFGLPAENAAIRRGVHPQDWTLENIKKMKQQFGTMGAIYDWGHEVITCLPNYYKWNQWIFLKMFERGLAYRGKTLSNWCPVDQCVLANENVENGKCWRCGSQVIQKEVEQWFLKITDFAEELLWPASQAKRGEKDDKGREFRGSTPNIQTKTSGVEPLQNRVDWPKSLKDGQNNWIGKSDGAVIRFEVKENTSKVGSDSFEVRTIEVFTTRPDTLFGATFMVLAPEHPLVAKITSANKSKVVQEYQNISSKKSELERREMKEKTGVFTGAYAINPVNGKQIPIWVADYVLMGYGTGAIMAVPAHDERDFEFAKKFDLPIIPVILPQREYVDKNTENYYHKRTEINRQLLKELVQKAVDNDKKLMVMGGWAVAIQVGQVFREFDDLDLIILEEDVDWWRDQLEKMGLTISNMFPEGKNDKYYFQATKQDVHMDLLAFTVGEDNNVISLTFTEPLNLNKAFNQMFEKKEFEGLPVYVLSKDDIYKWKKDHQERHNARRWKEEADFVMLGLEPYLGKGKIINSGEWNELRVPEQIGNVIEWLEKKGIGKKQVQYHLHDWSVSRQRYWGTPIPIIYCDNCGTVPVPEKDLPVELPYEVDYAPKGKPPLATATDWVNVKCPKCGGQAKRETETMDTFVDSSWYFLRYLDPKNDREPFDKLRAQKWMPVDIYFGGAEHTLGHTLYSRFFVKFLQDIGVVPQMSEYAKKRVHHGVILGPNGARMSKSHGNVVNPDEEVRQYGADAVRMYLAFLGPYDLVAPWDPGGIRGVYHFLQRVWGLGEKVTSDWLSGDQVRRSSGEKNPDNPITQQPENLHMMHKTIKKVTEDIENIKFNTAIAALMEWLNWLSAKAYRTLTSSSVILGTSKARTPESGRKDSGQARMTSGVSKEEYQTLLLLLAPFAPHITEELWQKLEVTKVTKESKESKVSGTSDSSDSSVTFDSIHLQSWPKYDAQLAQAKKITLVVQVNGKLRDRLLVEAGINQQEAEKLALASDKVQRWIGDANPRKVIFVNDRLINFMI